MHLVKKPPNEPLIIIDTFCLPSAINKDRYYTGMWNFLNNKEKNITFFVPSIVMTKNKKIFSVFKLLRLDKRNFLIKEDYLGFKDVLFSVNHFFSEIKNKTETSIFKWI